MSAPDAHMMLNHVYLSWLLLQEHHSDGQDKSKSKRNKTKVFAYTKRMQWRVCLAPAQAF